VADASAAGANDPQQSVSTVSRLGRYWASDYDLPGVEARLNALPQFTTEIDGRSAASTERNWQ
jgi:hypothetical protein